MLYGVSHKGIQSTMHIEKPSRNSGYKGLKFRQIPYEKGSNSNKQ